MSNTPSKQLSSVDQSILKGWDDIVRSEPEQILPAITIEEVDSAAVQARKIAATKDLALKVISKINSLSQQIDKKCSKFKAATNEPKGSPLFQAMVRVFQERTTTVTYAHYKKALEYRAQLAKEDSERIKDL